jgi:hypothetical protein
MLAMQPLFSEAGHKAVLLPMWAALGATAALITDCTIAVEKVEE